MATTVNWEELGIEANKDRRREARIPLAIPVEITGFDMDGKFFSDLTKTVDISERGCSFRLRRRVERGGVVAIKVILKDRKRQPEQKPFLYQIARATADGDRWIVGAAKLQPESVWFVAFPHEGKTAEGQQEHAHG
jgi:PilZ domain